MFPGLIRDFRPLLETIKKPDLVFSMNDTYRLIEKSHKLPSSCSLEACDDQFEPFHPRFSMPAQVRKSPPAPKIKGILLNTSIAAQAECIKDEIVGSSNGTGAQTFKLSKFPVIAEEIYINELNELTEGERTALIENHKYDINEVKDEKGNTTEFWVRWKRVEYLKESIASDRHYEIDRAFGLIQFGDGINGAVPPIGLGNIKVNYQAGGGAQAILAQNKSIL